MSASTRDLDEHDRAISLIVVDDQASIREALAAMLDLAADITVTATASNGLEALDAVRAHRPDLVLMDLHMPVMDGVNATRHIHEDYPETAVLVLTTFDDDASVLGALHAGASGYLTKDADRAAILRAARTAAAGQTVLTPEIQRRLLRLTTRSTTPPPPSSAITPSPPPTDPVGAPCAGDSGAGDSGAGDSGVEVLHHGTGISGITAREAEILHLIGEGLRNHEIAEELSISEATVKTHINNLFAKAGFRTRADAVRHVLTAHPRAQPRSETSRS